MLDRFGLVQDMRVVVIRRFDNDSCVTGFVVIGHLPG